MATAKPKTNGETPLKPVETVVDDNGLSKFTWNCRGGNESLTIRCESEDELKVLRDRWKVVISPPRRKLPYMHSGDECMVETCRGVMQTRTGTNRKTQQPYQYLRCSNHPTCQFTAYIENEENTPLPDDQIAAAQNGEAKNGAAHEPKAAKTAPVAA
jgi:hypothetical protein